MRNGVVADTLRHAGSPYRMIMGVNVPQLKEIATDFAPDPVLAAELRADSACRESQLLAPMVMPEESVDKGIARDWLAGLTSHEAADILCHSLLRRRPYALELVHECLGDDVTDEASLYGGIRLAWNLVNTHTAEILHIAEAEAVRNRPATHRLATALAEEARELLEFRNHES